MSSQLASWLRRSSQRLRTQDLKAEKRSKENRHCAIHRDGVSPGSKPQKNMYPFQGLKCTQKALCSTHEYGLVFWSAKVWSPMSPQSEDRKAGPCVLLSTNLLSPCARLGSRPLLCTSLWEVK